MKKTISKIFAPYLCLGIVFLISGCGAGSGRGLDEQGRPLAEDEAPQGENPPDNNGGQETPDNPDGEQPDDETPSEEPEPSNVTLSRIQSEIFSARCAQCHTGAGAPRGLRLDSLSNSFSLLVGVASDEVPSLLRVRPDDPDNSYLVRKIEGGPDIVGQQMPLGGPPLSAEQIALVREWISAGAVDDTAVSSQALSQSLKVSAVGIRKPVDTEKNLSLDLYFNQVIDLQSLADEAIQLSLVKSDQRRLLSSEEYEWQVQERQLTISYLGDAQVGDRLELVLNPSHSAVIQAAGGGVLNNDVVNADSDFQREGGFHYVYKF